MADFCQQCSVAHFGKDYENFKGISKPEDTAKGLFADALCEGCGPTQVDHEGKCVVPDCPCYLNDCHPKGRPDPLPKVFHVPIVTIAPVKAKLSS